MGVENEKAEQISGGEAKALEYANRVVDEGEDYHLLTQGLGPAMIASIDEAIVRRGYDIPGIQQSPKLDIEELTNEESLSTQQEKIVEYVTKIAENRSVAVQDLYKSFLENISDDEQRKSLIEALFGESYRKLRTADYGINPEEERTWEQTKKNEHVSVKEENGWMYRGVFPKGDEETATRGSFNVTVTPELVDELDSYIASGKVRANYKFGQPGTSGSPQERHDAISIYFLEKPNDEVLQELSEIIKPFSRGDDLLGVKVAEGFYLSEVGSVQDEHIKQFIEMFDGVDSSFAEAIKSYVTTNDRKAMSEAQFYAVKKIAEVFGYNISYDAETGFDIAV